MSKLGSRKLWLAVAGFGGFMAAKQYNEALAVVLTYLGVQGLADAKLGKQTLDYFVHALGSGERVEVEEEYEDEEPEGIQAILSPSYRFRA